MSRKSEFGAALALAVLMIVPARDAIAGPNLVLHLVGMISMSVIAVVLFVLHWIDRKTDTYVDAGLPPIVKLAVWISRSPYARGLSYGCAIGVWASLLDASAWIAVFRAVAIWSAKVLYQRFVNGVAYPILLGALVLLPIAVIVFCTPHKGQEPARK